MELTGQLAARKMTAAQVAAYLAEKTGLILSPLTLKSWRVRGSGPGLTYSKIGGKVYYDKASVDAYVDELSGVSTHTVSTTTNAS